MKSMIAAEATKSAPAAGGTLWVFLTDLPMNTWVGMFTIGYIAYQAVVLTWRWKKELKRANCEFADAECPTLCPILCRKKREK